EERHTGLDKVRSRVVRRSRVHGEPRVQPKVVSMRHGTHERVSVRVEPEVRVIFLPVALRVTDLESARVPHVRRDRPAEVAPTGLMSTLPGEYGRIDTGRYARVPERHESPPEPRRGSRRCVVEKRRERDARTVDDRNHAATPLRTL